MIAPSNLPSERPTSSFWLSELSQRLRGHRSTPGIPREGDVAIVGSGISGAFAGRTLLKNLNGENDGTPKVVMFEAREVCSGASGRNGGHCQPALYSGDTEIAKFEVETYKLISDTIRDLNIDCDWQPRGAVAAFYTQEDFDRAIRSFEQTKQNLPEISQYLKLITTEDNLSKLKVGRAKGAIVNTMAASLWPYKLVAAVIEDLLQGCSINLNLQTNTAVLSIERTTGEKKNKWKVNTARGSCIVKHVLLATNGYTSHLLPKMKDVIKPVRGNMIAGKGGAGFMLQHSYFLADSLSGEEHKDLVRVSERFIGDGEYLMQRPPKDNDTENEKKCPTWVLGGARFTLPNSGYGLSDDSVVDSAANKFLHGRLEQVLDSVSDTNSDNMTVTHDWTGILGYSKDGFPWVGEFEDGLWLCGGYSGHGMPQAALCADIVGKAIKLKLQTIDDNDTSTTVLEEMLPKSMLITAERLQANGVSNASGGFLRLC